MTDDITDLKLAMTPPAPDAARKRANLALAQENFATLQGSRDALRPMSDNRASALWTGAKTMLNVMTSKAALGATTAIVACGFIFLTPTAQDAVRGLTLEQQLASAPGNFTTPVTEEAADLDSEVMAQPTAVGRVIMPEMMADTIQLRAPNAALAISEPAVSPAPQSRADDLVIMQNGGSETYANAAANPVIVTADTPVSTFSIDVDTASYSLVRSQINRGVLPDVDAVRIEEMINYFSYDYAAPDAGSAPFRPTVSVMPTPWNADTQLVHIAIQGTKPEVDGRRPLNLVFLIDTSGSMAQPDKLPLLKQSFRLLLDNLRPQDEVAIVTYAGSAGQVLAPTAATDRATILAALNGLDAGGATNGQGGLEQAYAIAATMAGDDDLSRIVLATDGDFNVGINDTDALKTFISDKRDSGTYLSVLGFGRGNLDDATMQALAQNGNGQAAYIDSLSEAQKVLVDQLSGALFSIANDVKIQVEFNRAMVAEYRLIGYETRSLRREDFNNDAVDAGEMGAGHSVTAIYEVTPVGSPAILNDPLRYAAQEPAQGPSEMGFLKLRYKAPGDTQSQLIKIPITPGNTPSDDAAFAVAIAGFGQLLRRSQYLGEWSYADTVALATAHRGDDRFGYRNQAVQLMRLAQSLARQ